MEVDLFSIVITIIAFSFFIVPIVYDQRKKKNKEQQNDEQ